MTSTRTEEQRSALLRGSGLPASRRTAVRMSLPGTQSSAWRQVAGSYGVLAALS